MKHIVYTDTKEKEYSFIVLENHSDLHSWIDINSQIRGKQAIGFWMGFKSQTFRQTPLDYCQHEDNQNMMGIILGLKMTLSDKPTSITDFCSSSDALITDMQKSALQWINSGQFVRINTVGGMCPIEDYTEYDKVRDIDSNGILNFMLHKDIDYVMEITKQTVIIENGNYEPEKLISKICDKNNLKRNDIQVIKNFKQRTLLFKEVDFYNLFDNGINNGLANIGFETSAQDMRQILGLKNIIERIAYKHGNTTINIYADIPDGLKKELHITANNIKVHFLRN